MRRSAMCLVVATSLFVSGEVLADSACVSVASVGGVAGEGQPPVLRIGLGGIKGEGQPPAVRTGFGGVAGEGQPPVRHRLAGAEVTRFSAIDSGMFSFLNWLLALFGLA